MKFLLPAAAVAAIFLAATPAFATNQNQTPTNQTSVDQEQTQAQALNAAQLAKIQAEQNATASGGSTGAVSLENKTEGNKSFSSLSFGFTASNNTVNDDGYKYTKTYALMSIFGGVQIPVDGDDTAKVFQNLGSTILAIWFDAGYKPEERKFAKALACRLIPGVKDAAKDAGQECPE
jgi:hypothetical protein